MTEKVIKESVMDKATEEYLQEPAARIDSGQHASGRLGIDMTVHLH